MCAKSAISAKSRLLMCRLGGPLPIGPSLSFVFSRGLSGLAENMRTNGTMPTKSPQFPVELSGVDRLHAVFLSGVAWQEHRGSPRHPFLTKTIKQLI